MTPLEKKAIQHCIDGINKVGGYTIYSVLNDSLNKEKVPQDQKTSILRETNDAMCELVSEPIAEIRRWLEALIKP